jgi:hypothetical protein
MTVMADGSKKCETAFLEGFRLSYCSLIQVFFLQTMEFLHEKCVARGGAVG